MNRPLRSRAVLNILSLIALNSLLFAQQKVDPRNTHERLFCVVPIVGKGTADDPKRPKYAPLPAEMNPNSRTGILAYQFEISDNGQLALVEFVAADRAAFNSIRSDVSVKAFLKGVHKPEDIKSEFTKHKKDFSFDHFGVRMQ